jgi:hypothetical protein
MPINALMLKSTQPSRCPDLAAFVGVLCKPGLPAWPAWPPTVAEELFVVAVPLLAHLALNEPMRLVGATK